MTETRKLAAVMFTDIVGYTALMSHDEQKALSVLQKNRDIQKPLVGKFNGKFLKEMGDGTLLCFQSALDAVQCAQEIQQSLSDDPDLNLRIGIHLGDIVFKEGDIYGDGVNVASRIEQLADSGGIYISDQIYHAIRYKPGIEAVFLGEKHLKNVDYPVNIYRLAGEGLPKPSVKSDKLKQIKVFNKKRLIKITLPIVVVLLVLFSLYLIQKFNIKQSSLSGTGKNSIAVMYFENRSGEEGLERILTEMLTSNLSRCKEIKVISTQHLFDILKKMDKQDAIEIDISTATKVAKNAHVKTMLLGSINKIGTRFDINAQLCDVETGAVIGPSQAQGVQVEDIYQIVDQLTEDVIHLLSVSSDKETQSLKINDITTNSFEAYKHYQKGLEHMRRFEWRDAVKKFQDAVQNDTTFAMAYCHLAVSLGVGKIINPLSDLTRERELIRLANKYSKKTTEKEQGFIMSATVLLDRDYDMFLSRTTKGAELYPSDKEICYYLGFAQSLFGNYEQMIQSLNKVLEMDPKYGDAYNLLGYAYSSLNEHEKAISAIKKYIALQPDIKNSYDSGFEIYFMAGQYGEAYKICEDALGINPEWIQFIRYQSYISLFRGESDQAYTLIHDQIKRHPSQERILINDLGCFNMYEGRYGDAMVEFQKVIRVTQKNKNAKRGINAHLNLGKFYTVYSKFAKAHQEFSAAKQLSGDVYGGSYNTWPIRADYYSGVSYILQGDFNEAKGMAEQIKTYIEDNLYDEILMDYYYLLLSEIHIKKSQPTEALKMINMVSGITRRQNPRCCRLMAEIFILQGEYDSALQKYQELYSDWTKTSYYNFFEYFQERSMINYNIARLYEKKGDTQLAILYYQKALDQWKNADKDMTEFVDTQAKLAILIEKD